MKKPVINSTEIARLAGVSRSTVSRVVNHYPNVPQETREKVLKVIQQYHYVPNASAQALKGKKTRTIGFFLVETGRGADDFLSNMLIASTIESASVRGYYVLTNIIVDRTDADSIRGVREAFYQKRIDGAVFIGAANREPFIEELIAEGYHIAVMDQHVPDRDEPNRIIANFDSINGMDRAVSYLAEGNHTRIGYIQGDMNWYSGVSRYRGFVEALKRRNLAINEDWILSGGFSEKSGFLAMQRLLREGKPLPSAMLAANDVAAFGAVRALKEAGLNVPDDMSVIGYDDHPLSKHYSPALTTVRIDFKRLICETIEALIQTIEHGTGTTRYLFVGSEFLVRDSSLPLARTTVM